MKLKYYILIFFITSIISAIITRLTIISLTFGGIITFITYVINLKAKKEEEKENRIKKQTELYKKCETMVSVAWQDLKLNNINGKIKEINKNGIEIESKGEIIPIDYEDIILDKIIPLKSKFKDSHNRKSIPKSVKEKLWRINFGRSPYGKCIVCSKQIRINSFEAGHIVSVVDGGDNHIKNLEPICMSCNRSMGAMNLEEFKEEFFGITWAEP